MTPDHSESHVGDAGKLGDAQQPARRPTGLGEHDSGNEIGHAGIREDPPGTRDDLNADNSQGFTGEIGDRERQFPGSEAARRTTPLEGGADPGYEDERTMADLNPDDLDDDGPSDEDLLEIEE